MKKNRESFGGRVTATVIKIVILILLFPYQIVINRKEGKYGIRSLLLHLAINRRVNEEGQKSHSLTVNSPGYDFSALGDRIRKRKEQAKRAKKAEKRAKKLKKAAEKAEKEAESL